MLVQDVVRLSLVPKGLLFADMQTHVQFDIPVDNMKCLSNLEVIYISTLSLMLV